jgi:uncharacterized protein (UPF0332 family)
MSDRLAALLARARTEIDAARTLSSAGFEAQSISRAYYAAFYAGEAALLTLGEIRAKHSGVLAAFGRLVVKDGGLDPDVGGVLRRLFEMRNAADYSWLDAPESTSGDPVAEAQGFVDGVEAWIEKRR